MRSYLMTVIAIWPSIQLKDQASILKGVNRYEAGDPSSADSRQMACTIK